MASMDGWRERRRGRFAPVLFTTLATIGLTVALPQEGWALVVLSSAQGAALWLAFVAAGSSRRLIKIALAAWVVAAAITGLAATASGSARDTVGPATNLVLIAAAVTAILRHLLTMTRISRAAVGGVLTVYLMIGLFFGYLYATIGGIGDTAPLRGDDVVDLSAMVYFAFITLATVGYGDLVPATDLVRGVAITEALVGQLYLVSIVALVIGNLGRETSHRQSADDVT